MCTECDAAIIWGGRDLLVYIVTSDFSTSYGGNVMLPEELRLLGGTNRQAMTYILAR